MIEFIFKSLGYFVVFYIGSLVFNICPCDNAFNDWVIEKTQAISDAVRERGKQNDSIGVGAKFAGDWLLPSKQNKNNYYTPGNASQNSAKTQPDYKQSQDYKDKVEAFKKLKETLDLLNKELESQDNK